MGTFLKHRLLCSCIVHAGGYSVRISVALSHKPSRVVFPAVVVTVVCHCCVFVSSTTKLLFKMHIFIYYYYIQYMLVHI